MLFLKLELTKFMFVLMSFLRFFFFHYELDIAS